MPVPTYEQILLPLLKFSAYKKEHSSMDPIDQLARYFNLSYEEKIKILPNGSTVFYNRGGWVQTYLKQAGLLTSTKKGYFRITERGLGFLKQNPYVIDTRVDM